jgi:hypothetical protein
MFSPKKHFRSIAVIEIAFFFFLMVAQSLPLAAGPGLKKSLDAADVRDQVPGCREQAGDRETGAARTSRLLPTLLGWAVAGVVVAVLVLTVFKKTGYNPRIIPAEFVKGVSNLYFPVIPGRTRRYAVANGAGGDQLTVRDTADTKLIMGVLCLGVQERGLNSERLFEDTWRWYAQNEGGDVWFFAQETKKYDFDVVTEDWSWQAGSAGAKPGIVMPGHPQDYLNKQFQEELVPGVAEAKAQVLSLSATVTVPFGTFTGCLKVRVSSGRDEYRYYASGIGLIRSETVVAGGRRVELVGIDNQ